MSASAFINDRMDLLARVVPRGLGLGGVNAAVVGLLLAALYNPVWTAASSTSSSAAVCTENLNPDEPHVTRCFRSAEQDARAAHPCQTIDAFYHPERSEQPASSAAQ